MNVHYLSRTGGNPGNPVPMTIATVRNTTAFLTSWCKLSCQCPLISKQCEFVAVLGIFFVVQLPTGDKSRAKAIEVARRQWKLTIVLIPHFIMRYDATKVPLNYSCSYKFHFRFSTVDTFAYINRFQLHDHSGSELQILLYEHRNQNDERGWNRIPAAYQDA